MFADEHGDSGPDIQLTWTPNTQEGYINLKLTNKGSVPVNVSPYLNVLYGISEKEDPAALLIDSEAKTITAAVLILGPHPPNLSPVYRRGPAARPIEVGAGETKTIKFLADQNLIAIAKGSATIKFYLFLDHKAINMAPMTILKGSRPHHVP